MKATTKLGLSAAALLIAAGGVATMNDTEQDEYVVQYMASWAPANMKASTVQWGLQGNVRMVQAPFPPFDRKGKARRGDVAFTFVKMPTDDHDSQSFWCSVTVHGKTKTTQSKGRECYVAVQV